jgi:hypothetical protein
MEFTACILIFKYLLPTSFDLYLRWPNVLLCPAENSCRGLEGRHN